MFQSTLDKLVARVGARWAMIVGSDGMVLETNRRDFRKEAEAMAAEYAVFFRASRRAATGTGTGNLQRILMATEQGKILFQVLTPDYFLALFLKPASFAGKACFETDRVTGSLQKELTI
jgi:predicted regulator of Ras-like GTPase activity (Roadblock/LC7/MglB family)